MNRGQYLRLGFCFPPSAKSQINFLSDQKKKKKKRHKTYHMYPRQKLKTSKQKKAGTMPLG